MECYIFKEKTEMFNWKKKTSIFIGRFQPFHKGHKNLFINALKKSGQVAILVMDSYNENKKNRFLDDYQLLFNFIGAK